MYLGEGYAKYVQLVSTCLDMNISGNLFTSIKVHYTCHLVLHLRSRMISASFPQPYPDLTPSPQSSCATLSSSTSFVTMTGIYSRITAASTSGFTSLK